MSTWCEFWQIIAHSGCLLSVKEFNELLNLLFSIIEKNKICYVSHMWKDHQYEPDNQWGIVFKDKHISEDIQTTMTILTFIDLFILLPFGGGIKDDTISIRYTQGGYPDQYYMVNYIHEYESLRIEYCKVDEGADFKKTIKETKIDMNICYRYVEKILGKKVKKIVYNEEGDCDSDVDVDLDGDIFHDYPSSFFKMEDNELMIPKSDKITEDYFDIPEMKSIFDMFYCWEVYDN